MLETNVTYSKKDTYDPFLYRDRTRENRPLKCIRWLRRGLVVWPATVGYSLAFALQTLLNRRGYNAVEF
jgi:hypothetical protein